MRKRLLTRLLLAAPLLAAPAALAQNAPAAPPGTVLFFMTSSITPVCPQGWAAAAYASGRLLLGATQGTDVGKTVGTPLGNKEDRSHTHTYTTTLTLPSDSISGGSGCCNNQGAQQGNYTVAGTTTAATTGLPFIQLVVCEKQ